MLRSGAIDASLPVELERVWETRLCAPAFGHTADAADDDEKDEEGIQRIMLEESVNILADYIVNMRPRTAQVNVD